jgi:hypothetical protein
MLKGIWASDINHGTLLPKLGDGNSRSRGHLWATRSSDWMLDHFVAFARATKQVRWLRVRDAILRLVVRMQRDDAPATGLLPDFITNTNGTPRPAQPMFLETRFDGDFNYNACRTPWRIGTDALLDRDPVARRAVERMSTWIRSATAEQPSRIAVGYSLSGQPLGTGHSMAFTAPFAVAAMADPHGQQWLNRLWATIVAAPGGQYYPDSLRLLVMLMVSRNWWTP